VADHRRFRARPLIEGKYRHRTPPTLYLPGLRHPVRAGDFGSGRKKASSRRQKLASIPTLKEIVRHLDLRHRLHLRAKRKLAVAALPLRKRITDADDLGPEGGSSGNPVIIDDPELADVVIEKRVTFFFLSGTRLPSPSHPAVPTCRFC